MTDLQKRFEKLLKENSFSIKKCEDIGRRQLSYSINNHNKGHYLIFNIEGNPIKLIDVENKIKYDESIIRHLFMSVKEHSEGDSQLFLDSKNKHEIEDDDNETTSKSKDSNEQDNDASNKDRGLKTMRFLMRTKKKSLQQIILMRKKMMSKYDLPKNFDYKDVDIVKTVYN